jgi:hypothetical protein
MFGCKFPYYLKENALRLQHKDQLLNDAIYCENHKKHINKVCVEERGRNATFLNGKAGGTCSFKDLKKGYKQN